MNLYSFSVLCFSFGVTLVAILALMKRRDSVAYRFLIFSISICGWSYLFAIWISQQFDYERSLFLARTAYIFVMFIPITWLHFVFEFINKKEPFRFFYFINYGISFFFSLFCYSKLMIAGMPPFLNFKYLPIGGAMHHFHITHFFCLVSFGLFSLLKKYLTAEGVEKDQLRYYVWGALIGFISGGSIYVTYYRVPLPMYYVILMPLYPIFTGIALIRYGLFDVQQIADSFQREKITALGIMAASLNHEMRNPLYIAKGKIESFRDGIERQQIKLEEREKKTEETLSSVSNQLDRTLDIMQRFSDFARPQHMSKKENLNLKELLLEASELVSYEIQRKNVTLKIEAASEMTLRAHKRQMEEILVNLMINASQALTDQGGEIKVNAKRAATQVIIEISDNGPGIAEENQKKIFEPFFSTKGEKGSGLGLYITKQLIEKNGGSIGVRSKTGSGTVFTLTFKGQEL